MRPAARRGGAKIVTDPRPHARPARWAAPTARKTATLGTKLGGARAGLVLHTHGTQIQGRYSMASTYSDADRMKKRCSSSQRGQTKRQCVH